MSEHDDGGHSGQWADTAFEPWYCKHAAHQGSGMFCPPEGCSVEDGCARDQGRWPADAMLKARAG